MAALGQGQGQQGAGDGGQNGNGNGDGQQQQAGPDLSALTGALDGLSQGQQDLRAYLESAPWQQQAAGDQGNGDQQQQQEPAALDLSWIDTGDPAEDQRLAQQLSERINEHIGNQQQQFMQQMEEKFGQFDERISERERLEQARDLVEEFPEMGQEETANQVVGYASQIAQANGHPELANAPWFWRLTYMAGRAADAGLQEGQEPGGSGAAHLEGGGGANPGGGQGQANDQFMQSVLGVKRGSGVLPFNN